MSIPNPGSDEAILMGCKCPVLDNSHGLGFPWEGRTSFYISELCPVHNESIKTGKVVGDGRVFRDYVEDE